MFKTIVLTLAVVLFSDPLFADTVWLDVRSYGENANESLAGSINIPHTQVAKEILGIVKDKNAQINIFCRSGGRAGKALSVLQEMGYSNVKNVGSIGNARKLKEEE